MSVHDSAAHKSMVASQKTHTQTRAAIISTVASFSSIAVTAPACAVTALLLFVLLLLQQQLLQPVVGLSHTCASHKQVFNIQVSNKSEVALVRIKKSRHRKVR